MCRLCAVSCEEYLGRLMAGCRNGGGSLEVVGQAVGVLVLLLFVVCYICSAQCRGRRIVFI